MTLPTRPAPSPRVAALLEKFKSSTRARVVFALDATASREDLWDVACSLQSEMFAEVGKAGGLEVQLVWYRGYDECRASAWTDDTVKLAQIMRGIRCEAGLTKIGKVLAHTRAEHAREKISAVVFVGDAQEEQVSSLLDAAAGQPPWFMFQEGDAVEVTMAFKKLARLTGGAHCQFNAGAARELAELLRAVSAFASGGLVALSNQTTNAARLLLSQLK
jgi:hypothetical protein